MLKYFLEAEYNEVKARKQAGFRVDRSTIDHIFCLKQITKKKTARSQHLHLVYINNEKAYDSIPLANM